jgi:two-component system chemotaxis sensor kinase CheA
MPSIDNKSALHSNALDLLSAEAIAVLGPEIDHLALQVMLRGAQACSAEGLAAVLDAAVRFSATQLVQLAKQTAEQQSGATLTDDQARDCVSRMQVMIAPPVEAAVASAPAAVTAVDPSLAAFAEDPDLLADFIMEADEHLASIEEKILILEKDSSLIEAIHAVFRSFHSIKGLAGFLGLSGVQAVSHEVETLLDHARNLRITVSTQIVDIVLESSEYLKDEIEVIRAKLAGTPLPAVRDNSALLSTLMTATADIAAGRPFLTATASARTEDVATPSAPEPIASIEASIETPMEETIEMPVEEPAIEAAEQPETEAVEELPIEAPAIEPTPVEPIAEPLPEPLAEPIAAPTPTPPSRPTLSIVPPPEPARVQVRQEAAPAATPIARVEAANTSIRVETAKLDRLMDMVGEMVIAQSILSNIPRNGTAADARIAGEMSQLARITSEVQRCAMSMRMMPIGPLFQKNAKMVRDLSRRNGKQVALELFGETTELDKSIAEELSDPLLHMIRNALDHGIESPAERALTDKPAVASLRISAEHQAGQIVISISDDGRGLDPVKIRNKAIQNKLIEESEQLTEAEIFHLIFAPGFSTAEKITDISGRGVGMDVVRQHVESLRGRIEIRSKLGEGTTFLIHLPLTLAIIEGLVIVVGEHRYIIPLYSVREMLRPTRDMLFTVQGADEIILMRGSLLPLIRLHRRFAIEPRTEDICEGLLVVCEFAGKRYCLFVDDLLGRQEVVIKSLDEAFRNVRGVVGSAILGDGRIGLILDVAGIFHADSPHQEPKFA